MHGNVSEWVNVSEQLSSSPPTDFGNADVALPIFRGGSAEDEAQWIQSASILIGGLDWEEYWLGARLLRTGPKLTNPTAIPSHTWGKVKQERR